MAWPCGMGSRSYGRGRGEGVEAEGGMRLHIATKMQRIRTGPSTSKYARTFYFLKADMFINLLLLRTHVCVPLLVARCIFLCSDAIETRSQLTVCTGNVLVLRICTRLSFTSSTGMNQLLFHIANLVTADPVTADTSEGKVGGNSARGRVINQQVRGCKRFKLYS